VANESFTRNLSRGGIYPGRAPSIGIPYGVNGADSPGLHVLARSIPAVTISRRDENNLAYRRLLAPGLSPLLTSREEMVASPVRKYSAADSQPLMAAGPERLHQQPT
jgi:hypothetical protein